MSARAQQIRVFLHLQQGADPSQPARRRIRPLSDGALDRDSRIFCALHTAACGPSVLAEQLRPAKLLQAAYKIRSGQLLCEQLNQIILFSLVGGSQPG